MTAKLAETRWSSTALDRPARACLYRLKTDLSGITVEARVFPHGTRGFSFAVLVDGVCAPDSPSGKIDSLEEAARQARCSELRT